MSKDRQKTRVGRVISAKMENTIVVAVQWLRQHRLYKKNQRSITKFYADDKGNQSTIGDLVRIGETRALSHLKRWRLLDILERREVAEIKPVELDQQILESQRRGQVDEPAQPALDITNSADTSEATVETKSSDDSSVSSTVPTVPDESISGDTVENQEFTNEQNEVMESNGGEIGKSLPEIASTTTPSGKRSPGKQRRNTSSTELSSDS